MAEEFTVSVTGVLQELASDTDPAGSLTIELSFASDLGRVGLIELSFPVGPDPKDVFSKGQSVDALDVTVGAPDGTKPGALDRFAYIGTRDAPGRKVVLLRNKMGRHLKAGERGVIHIDEIRSGTPAGTGEEARLQVRLYDPGAYADYDLTALEDEQPLPIASATGTVSKAPAPFTLYGVAVAPSVVRQGELHTAKLVWKFQGPPECGAVVQLFPKDSRPVKRELDYAALKKNAATLGELFRETAFAAGDARIEMTLLPRYQSGHQDAGAQPSSPVAPAPAGLRPIRRVAPFAYVQPDQWTHYPLEFLGCPSAMFTTPSSDDGDTKTSTFWGVFLPQQEERAAAGQAPLARVLSCEGGVDWKDTGLSLDARVAMYPSALLTHPRDGGHEHRLWFVGGDQLRTPLLHKPPSDAAYSVPLGREAGAVGKQAVFAGKVPPARYGHRLLAVGSDKLLLIGGLAEDNTPLDDAWLLKPDPVTGRIDAKELAMNGEHGGAVGGFCGAAVVKADEQGHYDLYVLGGADGPNDLGTATRFKLRRAAISDQGLDWESDSVFDFSDNDDCLIAADIALYDDRPGMQTICVLATLKEKMDTKFVKALLPVGVRGNRPSLGRLGDHDMKLDESWRAIGDPHVARVVCGHRGIGSKATVVAWVLVDNPRYLGIGADGMHRLPDDMKTPQLNMFI